MLDKHPEFLAKEKEHNLYEIKNDPFVNFNENFYVPMKVLLCFVLPTMLPVYGWNESWRWSIMAVAFVRYIAILNITWLVNSAAHFWGDKPYNQ
jgi:stearoyl-CoA desaturase (Delta-9 desaturase)